jgi:hypothetical protein
VAKNRHLDRALTERSALYQEDLAREKRDHGGTARPAEAQVGTRTWKSYSRIRKPSPEFRERYADIVWTESPDV